MTPLNLRQYHELALHTWQTMLSLSKTEEQRAHYQERVDQAARNLQLVRQKADAQHLVGYET
jgi:hypothetical protein